MEFEEVDYWEELVEIMDWSKETCDLHHCICAGEPRPGFTIILDLKKRMLQEKMFGLFWHQVSNRKIPLVQRV